MGYLLVWLCLCSCVSGEASVGWLVTVVWGPAAEERVSSVLRELSKSGSPAVTLVVVDAATLEELPSEVDSLQRSTSAIVEIADPRSFYGERVTRDAFNGEIPGSHWFKNTFAYSYGLLRMRDLGVNYCVHIDDDVELLVDEPFVVNVFWQRISLERTTKDTTWVQQAIAGLEADPSVLSVHPLPLGPTPLGAHFSNQHDATSNCSYINEICKCDRPNANTDLVGNAFYAAHGAGSLCGHTIGGYRPQASHFSFQAFVMDLRRLDALLPLPPPLHRDVETLYEDAAHQAKLLPLFLEPRHLAGVVKFERQ